MSTFTYLPDKQASGSSENTIRESEFGDGYSQRQAFGINPRKDLWNLSFNYRTDAEIDAIIDFLDNAGSVYSFDWTPPIGDAGKFICKSWSFTYIGVGVRSLQATFKRVYEP